MVESDIDVVAHIFILSYNENAYKALLQTNRNTLEIHYYL